MLTNIAIASTLLLILLAVITIIRLHINIIHHDPDDRWDDWDDDTDYYNTFHSRRPTHKDTKDKP